MHEKSTKNCRSFVSERGEGEQQPLPAAAAAIVSSGSDSDAGRALLWRGYWRTTKITMKWKMHCKCRKTEPVYPFASFITGNWRLNVQKKERKTNADECVCVPVFACMHTCMYIMRLCQMADAKEGEAKQDGTEECQSICLCCGV